MDKVVSCRVDDGLHGKIEYVIWWDNLPNKSEAIKLLLQLGYEAWWKSKLEAFGIKK